MSPRSVFGTIAVAAVLGFTITVTDSFLGGLVGAYFAGFLWNAIGLCGSGLQASRPYGCRFGRGAAARNSRDLTWSSYSSRWRVGDARTVWIAGSMIGHLAVWLVLSLVQTGGQLRVVPYLWVFFGFGPFPGLFILLLCLFFTAFAIAQLNRATRTRSFRLPLVKANFCLSFFWLCQWLLPALGSYHAP